MSASTTTASVPVPAPVSDPSSESSCSCSCSSNSCGRFTLPVMTATRAAVSRVEKCIRPSISHLSKRRQQHKRLKPSVIRRPKPVHVEEEEEDEDEAEAKVALSGLEEPTSDFFKQVPTEDKSCESKGCSDDDGEDAEDDDEDEEDADNVETEEDEGEEDEEPEEEDEDEEEEEHDDDEEDDDDDDDHERSVSVCFKRAPANTHHNVTIHPAPALDKCWLCQLTWGFDWESLRRGLFVSLISVTVAVLLFHLFSLLFRC